MKCLNCECTKSTRNKKYCSLKCQNEVQTAKIIASWKAGEIEGYDKSLCLRRPIRNYLIKKANNKCVKCGWGEINPITGKVPLQVDHVDGDAKNCAEENLKVLCPNCHALTPTFGSLNTGKGYKKRAENKIVVC